MDISVSALIHMDVFWVDIHISDGILQQHRHNSMYIIEKLLQDLFMNDMYEAVALIPSTRKSFQQSFAFV